MLPPILDPSHWPPVARGERNQAILRVVFAANPKLLPVSFSTIRMASTGNPSFARTRRIANGNLLAPQTVKRRCRHPIRQQAARLTVALCRCTMALAPNVVRRAERGVGVSPIAVNVISGCSLCPRTA
jgi:hypothetical protein